MKVVGVFVRVFRAPLQCIGPAQMLTQKAPPKLNLEHLNTTCAEACAGATSSTATEGRPSM
jgi:hypothetical protein